MKAQLFCWPVKLGATPSERLALEIRFPSGAARTLVKAVKTDAAPRAGSRGNLLDFTPRKR